MIELTQEIREDIARHAEQEFPRECCGLLVEVGEELRYWPCENIAPGKTQFVLNPADYVRAEDAGTVRAVVHSHPGIPPLPSQPDRVACRNSGLPWLIVNYPLLTEGWVNPADEYEAPYVEREFSYGVLDCYTLAQDWYRRELGILLPHRADYGDEYEWWLNGKDLYSQKIFEDLGFVRVDAPFRQHDLHFMQIRSPHVPNHVAIQLDGGVILHHVQNRLSEKTVYGGFWQKVTHHTMRHRKLQSIA